MRPGAITNPYRTAYEVTYLTHRAEDALRAAADPAASPASAPGPVGARTDIQAMSMRLDAMGLQAAAGRALARSPDDQRQLVDVLVQAWRAL
jgi:hypothetical protein